MKRGKVRKAVYGWGLLALWAAFGGWCRVAMGGEGRWESPEVGLPGISWKVGGRAGKEAERRVRPEWRRERQEMYLVEIALPSVDVGSPVRRAAFQDWMWRQVHEWIEEDIQTVKEFAEELRRDPDFDPEDFDPEYDPDYPYGIEVRYSMGYLDDRLVSVYLLKYVFAPGAAHPWWEGRVLNFRLDEGRPLKAEEMFRSPPRRVWLEYCARQMAEYIAEFTGDEEVGEMAAYDLRRWGEWDQVLLTADGLVFVFNGFPYAMGEVQVCLVPWRKAVRLLRPEFRRLVGPR